MKTNRAIPAIHRVGVTSGSVIFVYRVLLLAAVVFNCLIWQVWVMGIWVRVRELGRVYHNRFPNHNLTLTSILTLNLPNRRNSLLTLTSTVTPTITPNLTITKIIILTQTIGA